MDPNVAVETWIRNLDAIRDGRRLGRPALETAVPCPRYDDDGRELAVKITAFWWTGDPKNPGGLSLGAAALDSEADFHRVFGELGDGEETGNLIVCAGTLAVYDDGLCVPILTVGYDGYESRSGNCRQLFGWDRIEATAFELAWPELARPVPTGHAAADERAELESPSEGDGEMTGKGMMLTTHQGRLCVAILDRVLTAAGWGEVCSWGDKCVIVRLDKSGPIIAVRGLQVETVRCYGLDIIAVTPWPGNKFPTRAEYDEWTNEQRKRERHLDFSGKPVVSDKPGGPITGVDRGGPSTDLDANR